MSSAHRYSRPTEHSARGTVDQVRERASSTTPGRSVCRRPPVRSAVPSVVVPVSVYVRPYEHVRTERAPSFVVALVVGILRDAYVRPDGRSGPLPVTERYGRPAVRSYVLRNYYYYLGSVGGTYYVTTTYLPFLTFTFTLNVKIKLN